MTPRLSFFMASKNRAHMIGPALQSIVDQLYPDWELVICDGSDSPYMKGHRMGTVRSWPGEPRIRVLRQVNSGPAEGFQLALDRCKGEFVFPIADDDSVTEQAAAVAVAALAGTGNAWGYAQTSLEQDGKRVMVLGDPFDRKKLRSQYYLGGAVFWRRSLTERLGGFDTERDGAADWDLYLRMAEDSDPVVVPTVLYRYNDHAWTDSRVNASRQAESGRRIVEGAVA